MKKRKQEPALIKYTRGHEGSPTDGKLEHFGSKFYYHVTANAPHAALEMLTRINRRVEQLRALKAKKRAAKKAK